MKKYLQHIVTIKISIIGFCLLFLLSARAFAATYYVATNGNDNNTGTMAAPFATIGKGASVAVAGDVVIIRSGIYKPTNRIQPANSGTATAPITFMAEVKNEVIIDGSNATSPTTTDRLGLFTILGTTTTTQNWIIVDGLRIINSTFVGFYARYANNITFKNCSTFNTGASGIIGANSMNIKVLTNTVQRACQAPSTSLGTNECITMASVDKFEVAYNSVSDRMIDLNNGGEGIDAKNECKDGSIHHNTVFDLVRLGIYIDGFERNLSNIDVYANTVYNCRKGIVAAIEAGGTSSGVKIHNNIVYDNSNGGIQAAGYLVGGIMKDVSIYQNTVVRCGLGNSSFENFGIMADADNASNSGFIIRNNIVAECGLQIKTRNQSYITVDNNLLFGPSSTPASGTNVFGNPGTNAILADPLFENSAKNNFKLKANSPAIGKATGTPLSKVDFNDVIRPAQGSLGAIESQNTPVVIVLGVENPQALEKDIVVYPNPSNGTINLKVFTNKSKSLDIEIVDLQGNSLQKSKFLVDKAGINLIDLSVETLTNGTYIVRVNDSEGNKVSKKLIVQK